MRKLPFRSPGGLRAVDNFSHWYDRCAMAMQRSLFRGTELMELTTTAFGDMQPIPPRYAFCALDPATHARLSDSLNPSFAWREVPPGTRSFALICVDVDVPSRGDDVNQEGKVVAASLPRVPFYHWGVVDIPGARTALAEGAYSSSVTARGKPGPQGPGGTRQGINDYTGWVANDKETGGGYN